MTANRTILTIALALLPIVARSQANGWNDPFPPHNLRLHIDARRRGQRLIDFDARITEVLQPLPAVLPKTSAQQTPDEAHAIGFL